MFLRKKKVQIFAYDDYTKWGRHMKEAGRRQGVRVKLFESASQVPDRPGTIAFVRLTTRKHKEDKQMAIEISKKKNVVLVPRIEECRFFYNKIAQAAFVPNWMPKTWIVYSPQEALKVLEEVEVPFVSKSSEGHKSKNVRLIKCREEAKNEIESVFSGEGVPVYDGYRQKGYLLWQEFLPDNPYDWRVVIIDKKYAYAFKRNNRVTVPFASGSGRHEMPDILTPEMKELFDFGFEFASKNDQQMCALDVLKDKNGRYVISEFICMWGWDKKDLNNRIYERINGRWQPTEYQGRHLFDLFVKLIMDGGLC